MIGENSDVPRQSYCFATCNPRCESCANYRKWIELNQFPDALRKPLLDYSKTEQIQIELESLGIVETQECTA